MISINSYKEASLDFRRLFSTVMRMDYTEGSLHLIRLKNYIDSNEIVSSIIQKKISSSDYDYKVDFIVTDGHNSWKYINAPISEDDHVKAMYDYMSDICNNGTDLTFIARGFYYSISHKKYNDIVRVFLEKAFKPLADFIIDSLSKQIMLMEEEKIPQSSIIQKIEHNYGTANIASRDIHSINNINSTICGEINDLIKVLKKQIDESSIDTEEKDILTDDLEIIGEQLASPTPKVSRLKKTIENFSSVFNKVPGLIGTGTQIVINSQSLVEKVKAFIDSIS